MIVSLCGFMGAGKSTIGKFLAKITGYDFIDLDLYIQQREHKSIPEIFSLEGEKGFRQKELLALQEIVNRYTGDCAKNMILSLGGGTVTEKTCAELIRTRTRCIYLYCTKEELARRLKRNTAQRPLLQGKSDSELIEHIANLMNQREQIYKSCAHITISTQEDNLPQIVNNILSII